MIIKTLFIRFYKSFNYDYLRKSHPKAKPDPWDTLEGDLFYPFVRISLESDVTTVVGANESGKSQLLSAIKCLLTGEQIERRDFCRYSSFFVIDKEMAVPEFGAEFSRLSEAQAEVVRELGGLADDAPITSFYFFRLNGSDRLYMEGPQGFSHVDVNAKQHKQLMLPTYLEIDAKVPLPDSVPLDYLVSGKAPTSRSQFLRWAGSLRDNLGWFKSPEEVQKSAPKIIEAFAGEEEGDDTHLLARLKLAQDLLLRVAGIDKTAFQELRHAIKISEGYANGIVDKMNRQIADTLNFPKWWSQDSEFSLSLTLRDFDLVFTVRDRTGSDYSFSERSSGLSYFLSYFVQYLLHRPSGGQEMLLMDEPDAYLSTQGQQDLLKIFDSFAKPADPERSSVQVVYVTHSPFLIDKNHAERIRVLEKGHDEEGTRVVANVARNHYEPLRSAFGAFVAETTFISNCNLMLEGQADQVLLAGMSSLVRRLKPNGEALDLNGLSLVPTGSAEHVPYMVYLARGRDVDTPAIVVLLDSDAEADGIAQELRAGYRGVRLIDDDFIIQVGTPGADLEFDTSTSGVQEIEDLLLSEVAQEAVKHLAREVLSAADAEIIERDLGSIVVKSGEKLFWAARAAAEGASTQASATLRLDKVAFARSTLHVMEHDVPEDIRDRVLANFEKLCGRINRAQREAMRRNERDRISRTLNRLRRRFLNDHPHSATRRDVQALMEDIDAQLPDGSIEAESVRSSLRVLRVDFKLHEEPLRAVDDFEGLRNRLESLTYEAERNVQI